MKHENQHEFVRTKLMSTPRSEWMRIAADAEINIRTLYNVADPHRKPTYETVFNIYKVLKDRKPAPRAAK